MNWKSIKSFLILLVVLVDVLLLRFCYTYYTSRDYTAHSTAEDAAAILGESGITVSPDLLAVRADSVPARSCTYTREDYARLVLSLLSAAVKSIDRSLPSRATSPAVVTARMLSGRRKMLSVSAALSRESTRRA